MKILLWILYGLFIATLCVSSGIAQDSLSNQQKEFPISIMKPVIPDFLLEQPARFSSFALDIITTREPGSLNRWGMYSPDFFDITSSSKIDLTSPLKLQLQRKEENKTLYSIIGSVQLGGTAYLLYQHIKKNKGIK